MADDEIEGIGDKEINSSPDRVSDLYAALGIKRPGSDKNFSTVPEKKLADFRRDPDTGELILIAPDGTETRFPPVKFVEHDLGGTISRTEFLDSFASRHVPLSTVRDEPLHDEMIPLLRTHEPIVVEPMQTIGSPYAARRRELMDRARRIMESSNEGLPALLREFAASDSAREPGSSLTDRYAEEVNAATSGPVQIHDFRIDLPEGLGQGSRLMRREGDDAILQNRKTGEINRITPQIPKISKSKDNDEGSVGRDRGDL